MIMNDEQRIIRVMADQHIEKNTQSVGLGDLIESLRKVKKISRKRYEFSSNSMF